MINTNSDKTLVVALVENLLPFSDYNNVTGKAIGFDVDLSELIAKELEQNLEFKHVEFAGIIDALENEEIDIVPSRTDTVERRKQIDFSNSYYAQHHSLITFDKSLKASDDFTGKRIGVLENSSDMTWFKTHKPQAILVSFDNNSQIMELLNSDGVIGVMTTSIEFFAQLNSKEEIDRFHIIDFGTLGTSKAIALKKNSILKEEINNALEKIICSGEMAKLKAKWGFI